jgi:competence protein ComEA
MFYLGLSKKCMIASSGRRRNICTYFHRCFAPIAQTQAPVVNAGRGRLVMGRWTATAVPLFDNGEHHMIKKLMLAVATLVATMGIAFAQVDVNKADAAALDSVKGVGPAMSKQILDERTKAGDFKDWADFQKRVKGVGEKRAAKLSQAGLQVNGKAKEGAPMDAKAAETKPAKTAKAAKTDAKKPADKAAM